MKSQGVIVVFALVTGGGCSCGSETVPGRFDVGALDGVDRPPTGCNAGTGCPPGQRCTPAGTCVPDVACVTEDDCEPGYTCDSAMDHCVIGSPCGAQAFGADPVPPNLLVVLDRSCSMDDQVMGVTKWQSAVDALVLLTTEYASSVRFGLALFPDLTGGDCAQEGPVQIPCGPGNDTAIQSLLTAALVASDPFFPNGPCVTNIDTAMEQAAAAPELMDDTRSNYVLLVTDGRQSTTCRSGSDGRTNTAIDGLTVRGIPSYVVGFGGGVDPGALNGFAMRGGTALPTDPSYYQADNGAALSAALGSIVGGLVSCEYQLDRMPEDLSLVHAFFNDSERVERDEVRVNGWDYEATTGRVIFYGPACDALRAGTVTDVDIVFGCPGPVIE